MTKHEAAVVSAYTGFLIGEFHDMHCYVEKLLGRPVWTHQFADPDFIEEVRVAAKPDWIEIHEYIDDYYIPEALEDIPNA